MILRVLILLSFVLISCEKLSLPPEMQPILSSDILFLSIRNGQTIVLSDIDGNNQFPITTDFEDQWEAFFVSNEGDIIYSAFLRGSKTRSIYKFNIDTKKVVRITDDSGSDSYPAISNDGTMLAFSSDRNNELNAWNIFIQNLQTNEIKQITQGTHHYYPRFSPDDSKILFSEYSNGSNHLSIINTNGTKYKILDSQQLFYSVFQFSLNSDRIYSLNDQGVISCDLNGNDKIVIVSDSTESISTRFINPIDSTIFYTKHNYLSGLYRLYKINILTLDKVILKESSERLSFGDCTNDGTKILLQQFVNGRGDIVLLDLVNSTEKFITNSEYHDHSPKFNKFKF